jgi:hypothetical protein
VTRAKPSPPPGGKASPAAAKPSPTGGKPSSPARTAAPRPAAEKAAKLADDPVAVILSVLENAGKALAAGAIKQRLVAGGVGAAEAERAWDRSQEKIRFHEHVVFDNRAYRYTARPRTITPAEALYHLARGGTGARRAAWLAVIEAALAAEVTDPAQLDDARTKIAEAEQRIIALEAELAETRRAEEVEAKVEESPHDRYDRAERRRAARERQARIDAMSTVAELAAEVEELTAKRASAEVLLEHTRALTGDRGLEAIGRAGRTSPYDAKRHDPVGDVPDEGEPVIVIRPGYLWHAPGEAVLISRALVSRA